MAQARDYHEILNYQPILIDALEALRQREIAQKAPFKARAYQTVLQQLKAHPTPIHAYEDIQHFTGLGDKLREKLHELFDTGHLQAAQRAKEDPTLQAMTTFQQVYGIGPTKARALVQAGIRTIPDLRTAVQKIPDLLHDKQRIGLQYYEDLLLRIPREEMVEHERLLLSSEPSPFTPTVVGSYRRLAPHSGDIDVLLRVPSHVPKKQATLQFRAYVQQLQTAGYIEQLLALGDHKCMAICRLPGGRPARRLDLLLTPEVESACALLYFTGSDQFNVAVRQHALQKGYTLNEHRLTPSEPSAPLPPPFHSEEDLFHFLGLAYIPPENRVDASSLRLRMKRPVLRKKPAEAE